MKKTLLLGLLAFAGFTANAQLANGSTAPDFTVTDINGGSHSLYADYLNQGKTVIIDFSATWCGPCWNYHGTHALADLHQSFGPGGSSEVVVLFVEGDPQTLLQDIYGDPSQPGITQGNWTIGSPYPIIDDADLADAYQIAYFPTVYRICPTGTVTLVDQQSAVQLRNGINTACAEPNMTGVQNHAEVTSAGAKVCETGDNAVLQAKMKNFGTNAITNATLVIKNGETVVGTKNYTGNLAQFGSATVNFDAVGFTEDGVYTVEVSGINAAAPHSAATATQALNVKVANEVTNNIEVRIYTDNYPSEISWRLKDANNTVVASGGPYQPGTADQWGGGGPDANTTKVHNVVLPEGVDCYSVELLDSYGDGWALGTTTHGIEIFTAEGSAYYMLVGNFGSTISDPTAIRANGLLNNETVTKTAKFAIYPNPSNGIFNFTTEEAVDVTIVDLTGKVVYTAKEINNEGSINLSSLQKGMYLAKVKSANGERIEKLIIK